MQSYESGRYGSPRRSAVVAEAPSGGVCYGQRVLISGGGGIVGSALLARVLREGGAVIAVRSPRSLATALARAHVSALHHGGA